MTFLSARFIFLGRFLGFEENSLGLIFSINFEGFSFHCCLITIKVWQSLTFSKSLPFLTYFLQGNFSENFAQNVAKIYFLESSTTTIIPALHKINHLLKGISMILLPNYHPKTCLNMMNPY